tara:strand:+ start:176 stop:466 length:291 start_codon:yes stop_codon:yes gene_type:complete
MSGPIFDPLNPNESPASKYQRKIDAMNKGGSRKKSKDKELEESIISDEENEPLDLIYGNQRFNPKTGMYQTMKKGGQVKKRNNFSGRGAGLALRGF